MTESSRPTSSGLHSRPWSACRSRWPGPMEAHGPSVKVIAKHLNNPRGVAVTWDGRVLVAAAGIGRRLAGTA